MSIGITEAHQAHGPGRPARREAPCPARGRGPGPRSSPQGPQGPWDGLSGAAAGRGGTPHAGAAPHGTALGRPPQTAAALRRLDILLLDPASLCHPALAQTAAPLAVAHRTAPAGAPPLGSALVLVPAPGGQAPAPVGPCRTAPALADPCRPPLGVASHDAAARHAEGQSRQAEAPAGPSRGGPGEVSHGTAGAPQVHTLPAQGRTPLAPGVPLALALPTAHPADPLDPAQAAPCVAACAAGPCPPGRPTRRGVDRAGGAGRGRPPGRGAG